MKRTLGTPRRWSFPALAAMAVLAALPLAAATVAPDEGQGTAEPGSNTSQLSAGEHLLGAEFSAADMLGKIVIVEIGGS